MRNLSLWFFSILLVFPVLVQAQSSIDYVPGEIIVKFKEGSNNATTLGKVAAKAQVFHERSWSKLGLHQFSMKASDNMINVLNRLKEDRNVEYAEPNYYVEATEVQSYGATDAEIHVVESWDIVNDTESDVVPIIAVIDSGLDINHPVFKDTGRLWTNPDEAGGGEGTDDDGNGYFDDLHGWNFKDNTPSLYDGSGHGTHVAGIALGVSEDIFNLDENVPAKVQIMPLKFLNENGVGKTSDAIEAVYYAVNNGASVISNSWGGSNYSAGLHEALTYAYNKGAIVISASGNFEDNNDIKPLFPANYDIPSMISVAATTSWDTLASFSNYGSQSVHIAAPGVQILSTAAAARSGFDNKFEYRTGTSMAAPFISGLAAVLMREAPQLSGYQIKQKILQSGRYVSELSQYTSSGKILNAESAVSSLNDNKTTMSYEQPDYAPVFQQGRSLASATSFDTGFGCGQVSQMYDQANKNFGQKSSPKHPSFGVLVLILLPVLVAFVLKYYFRQDERRGEERRRVLIPGRIITEDGWVESIQVQCWSASGAGLQLSSDISKRLTGKTLRLQLNTKYGKVSIPVARVVRHNEGGYLGLKFES